MTMQISRRGLLKAAGAGVAATSLASMGFGEAEAAVAAHVRPLKLANTTETRNTCPYCSVACGIILYSKGDVRKGEKAEIIHVEGDVDHPTNLGTLCPKGAALKDFIHAPTRLKQPMVRRPGSDRFEPVSWDQALDRIARLMKDDRDANFLSQNDAGTPVNRWTTFGMLAASATTNETAWCTFKVAKALGIVGFDNQARV